MKIKFGFVFTISIVAIWLSACSAQTTPTAQPAPTQAPLPTATVELGSSSEHPAAFGSEVVADDMGFTVIGITRPATGITFADGRELEPGEEFTTVRVQVNCKRTPEEKCNYTGMNLQLLGSTGVQRGIQLYINGLDDGVGSVDIYGGETIVDSVCFVTRTDETGLTLIYITFRGVSYYLATE